MRSIDPHVLSNPPCIFVAGGKHLSVGAPGEPNCFVMVLGPVDAGLIHCSISRPRERPAIFHKPSDLACCRVPQHLVVLSLNPSSRPRHQRAVFKVALKNVGVFDRHGFTPASDCERARVAALAARIFLCTVEYHSRSVQPAASCISASSSPTYCSNADRSPSHMSASSMSSMLLASRARICDSSSGVTASPRH